MTQAADLSRVPNLVSFRQRRSQRSKAPLTWDHVRRAFLFSVLTLLWLVPNPNAVNFEDDPNAGKEGTLTVQIIWLGLLLFGVISSLERVRELRKQFDATLVLLFGWCLLTTVFAIVPDTSFRRLIFTFTCVLIFVLAFSGIKEQKDILKVLITMCVVETVVKFFFVFAIPSLGKHGYFGSEPQLAGLWRGQYAHKNAAGPVCAIELVFLFASRKLYPKYVIVPLVLAEFVFLFFSGSKTSLYLIFAMMLFAAYLLRMRGGPVIFAIVGCCLAAQNTLTLGSMFNEDIQRIVQAVIGDVTFTGRVELWKFLIRYSSEQPLIGAGFQSFWQIGDLSPAVSQGNSWSRAAVYGHQGWLDTLVMIGMPGVVLLLLFVLVRPAFDAGAVRNRRDPMLHMYMSLWLFGLFENGTESVLLARSDGTWLFMIAAIVGLRRLRYEAAPQAQLQPHVHADAKRAGPVARRFVT